MKRILYSVVFMIASIAHAAAADAQGQRRQAKRTATDLFASGQTAAAVAHLNANLAPEAGPDGSTIALAQGLMEIAGSLYNQRRLSLAREAVTQAFVAAAPVLQGRSNAAAVRRAGLVSSLGLLAENVLLDAKRAEELYTAAEALNPSDSLHGARKKAIADKQKPKASPGSS